MITVTKGQWFPLTIKNISYGGVAFDIQSATDVSVTLEMYDDVCYALTCKATAYNELSCVSGNEDMFPGKYGIEMSCTGKDGRSYRMKSNGPFLQITEATEGSSGDSIMVVSGDTWELTADVEIHEGEAQTYMSLLEEARKSAIDAAEKANAAAKAARDSAANIQKTSLSVKDERLIVSVIN